MPQLGAFHTNPIDSAFSRPRTNSSTTAPATGAISGPLEDHGLGLSDAILRKVYHANAERLLQL